MIKALITLALCFNSPDEMTQAPAVAVEMVALVAELEVLNTTEAVEVKAEVVFVEQNVPALEAGHETIREYPTGFT